MDTIALFCSKYPPYRGGSPNYYESLVNSANDEFEFVVFSSYHSNRPIVERGDDVVVYRTLPVLLDLPWPFRLVLETVVAALTLTYVIIRQDIDLVHSHSTSYAIPGIAFATRLTSRPIIYDCRDEAFPPRLIQTGITPNWFSASSNIDEQLADAGVESSDIVRTPVVNPSYVSEYSNVTNPTDGPYRICFCGRFRVEKNVPILIDAFAEFHSCEPDASLTLVGDGLTRNEVEARIDRYDIGNHVEVTGELSHRNTLKTLSNCDVMVLPSESEGVPRVIMEAFEIGVPVITTDAGGIQDVVTDGKTGIIVDPRPTEIAEALERIRTDDEFRERLIANGRELSGRKSWDRTVNRVTSTYRSALEG